MDLMDPVGARSAPLAVEHDSAIGRGKHAPEHLGTRGGAPRRRRMSGARPSLLERADTPGGLRRLPEACLEPLATQLREFLVDSVSRSGGHLSAGLGTVELAIALHYVFDTPRDSLVWDVGHQCYPHLSLIHI